jgi:TatD DNase family protein
MKHFNKDRDQVLQRARDAGVAAVIDVGCDIASSESAIGLAEEYDGVFATVGFHPHSASELTDDDLDKLAELTRHRKVVAIGEIGLDFYRNLSPKETQLWAFKRQLALARECGLPVVIHSRQAGDEVLDILTEWSDGSNEPRGVLHCFSGDMELVRRYIGMGFLLSIAGPVTYPSSSAAEIARDIPLDRLLIETDCPFLTPEPYRGKRNEPAYVSFVAEKIAEIRRIPVDSVKENTSRNAARMFGLPL